MGNYIELFKTNPYRFYSENNILQDRGPLGIPHLGICSNVASIGAPEYATSALEWFVGCPYINAAFKFEIRTDGERVKTREWEWLPNAIYRHGEAPNFHMDVLTAVVPDMRTFIVKAEYKNKLDKDQTVPIQVAYRGRTKYEDVWGYTPPQREKCHVSDFRERGAFIGADFEDKGFWLTSSLENLKMFREAYLWEGEITIPANGKLTVYFSAHMGETEKAFGEAEKTHGHYEELLEKAFAWLVQETDRIDKAMPRLSSSNPRLDALFSRAYVTYILCRWENPDLCITPWYSTGSINGSCMCSYLWDYCGGLMMHPLFDPEGNKIQLKTFLKNDLTTSFSINPVTGGKYGPWYQVNHEKIICMVYYHVLFTGDKAFLFEKAGDKTIIEWMRFHAYVCDDVSKDVELYDYGDGGKAHLELLREYVYNGIIPDLNARRYMNYMRVYELTKVAGHPDENLPKRAAALKEKVKELWNEDAKWYDFINKDGIRDIRYTVQMFKFLNSPVIDEKERVGLISHLNEKEFLSKFGLHSMSKLDKAYDQDDIDNGGGGGCTHFTMQICAQLYEMGYDKLATDILSRVLWWGERLPYLGDSCAANMVKNSDHMCLQGDISSVSAAQMMFYYIFGIRADFDGNIMVTPVKNRPAENMKIDNARLCGKVFSVDIQGDTFSVIYNGTTQSAPIGETISI